MWIDICLCSFESLTFSDLYIHTPGQCLPQIFTGLTLPVGTWPLKALPSSTTRTDKPQALSTSGLFCSWIKQRWQESLFLFVYFLHKLIGMLTGGLASLVANKVRVRMSTYLLRDTIQLITPSKWKMKPYSTNSFVVRFFHSARCLWDSFILSYVVVVSSVSLLHNIPFCKYTSI